MSDLRPVDNIRVYFNAKRVPSGVRYPGVAVPIPGPRLWTLRTLAMEMRRDPPDLLFVPSHVIPPVHPKSVVTVHDLGYLVEPDCHQPIHRKQLEWTTRWNCAEAAGIVAVSQSTRQDLIDRLDISPASVHVIHHGVSPAFHPASQDEIDKVRTAHALPERFILAVGTIHPRKNLIRLIQAFEQLAADDAELALVLCGNAGWRAEETLERARRSPFSARVRHLGYVGDSDMAALYSAASVTAFVSLYEGFGLPALESMACGTPVVAADRAALPEICGGAAVLVDPNDTLSISGAIRLVLADHATRARLVREGKIHAESFTWQKCALQTLAFLRAIRDNSI